MKEIRGASEEIRGVSELEEAMRTGSGAEARVKRLELNEHLESQHSGAIVRARIRATGSEGIRTA